MTNEELATMIRKTVKGSGLRKTDPKLRIMKDFAMDLMEKLDLDLDEATQFMKDCGLSV